MPTVFFEDTDAYGIVYYANYREFMERRARTCCGPWTSTGGGAQANGRLMPSSSAGSLPPPARLSDDIVVVSTVDSVRASSVDIQQRVMRSGELLVEGNITAAFLDGQGRPRRHPKDWVGKFERFVAEE